MVMTNYDNLFFR